MASDDGSNSTKLVGFASGGARAISAQFLSFYTRVPVKLFRPARVDYTRFLRSLTLNAELSKLPWNFWTHSNPALLVRAVRSYGWSVVPDKLLPPVIANSLVGAVLYTAYLGSLNVMEFMNGNNLPTIKQSFLAGGLAGGIQAIVATPLDAVATRFDADILRKENSLWSYGYDLLRTIGPRAALGGVFLNTLKESSSFALFFAVFEGIKGPFYREYGAKNLYPVFVLAAGCFSAASLQIVNYPLSKIQKVHTLGLQAIDQQMKPQKPGMFSKIVHPGWQAYAFAYEKTFRRLKQLVEREAGGSWRQWLWSGGLRYTLYSMPSASIGLFVFEVLRQRENLRQQHSPSLRA